MQALLRFRQAPVGFGLITVSVAVLLLWYREAPILGVAAYPLLLLGLVRNLTSGEPVPGEALVYLIDVGCLWAGAILVGLEIWRRRKATTVQPRQSAAGPLSRSSVTSMLGGHPTMRMLKGVALLYGLPVLAIAGSLHVILHGHLSPDTRLPLVVITGFGALIFLLLFLGTVITVAHRIGIASGSAWRVFGPAVDAVVTGAVGCTYAVRGAICEGGLVIVDEMSKRIWLNGEILPFADVDVVRWDTNGRRHVLALTVRSGATPVIRLSLDSHDQLMQAHGRLCNSLGI